MESSNQFEDLRSSSLFVEAKDAALRFLSYRSRSEAEVRRRLSRKYSPEVIESVVEALHRQRFLDDKAFAQQWRNSREQHRPRAKRLVQQELFQRGVASEVIQDSLDGFDDEANAYQAGIRLARRQSIRNSSEDEFRRRLSSHLQRRGFSYGVVRVTVARIEQELRANSLDRENDPDNNEQ